jgi:subtilase family serine protease
MRCLEHKSSQSIPNRGERNLGKSVSTEQLEILQKGVQMIRGISVSLLAIVVVLIGSLATPCQAERQYLLTHHVRTATANGQAPSIGRLPANRSMQVDMVLSLRDPGGLESFLKEVYDPSSPIYHHYVTVKQFTERFGPSQSDYDAVVRFAKANGLTVVGGSRDAMDVQARGPVSALESAFHVTMGLYHDPIENRDFYAPDREPAMDLPFRLWHISGLDNYALPRPALVRRPEGAKPLATTGSCPQASYCGSDMRAAYYGGTLTGHGQYIGLLEYLGIDSVDVNTYYTNAKQTRSAPITAISTDGTSTSCTAAQFCDDTEQTLDITQALGMAPAAANLYVFVGSTDTALLGAMSSASPLPLNLSSSWYWPPPDATTDNPYFQKMAAQGQSFFEAAGDGGAWATKSLWWPMESQFVISVGGTSLTTTGPGGAWASETTWVYGGGGISQDSFSIPPWQTYPGVITTANQGSTTLRNGPDVSANSDFTFYVCADQSGCTANYYGGTSFAAPMFAGYMALVNQYAAFKGVAPPGFINPRIYFLGIGPHYNGTFHDITTGSNGFPAVTGYDLATGWGSPNGSGLIYGLTP